MTQEADLKNLAVLSKWMAKKLAGTDGLVTDAQTKLLQPSHVLQRAFTSMKLLPLICGAM